MDSMTAELLRIFCIFIILVFVVGFYCIVATHNLIRALIGMEILTKGVTLLIIVAGYVTGRMGLAQACVITLIVIEVVIIIVTGGVILSVYRRNGSVDVRDLRNLKG